MSFARMNNLAMLIERPLQLVRIFLAVGAVARWRYPESRFCAAGCAAGFHWNIP
jgi:hypothetical protein